MSPLTTQLILNVTAGRIEGIDLFYLKKRKRKKTLMLITSLKLKKKKKYIKFFLKKKTFKSLLRVVRMNRLIVLL
jgi:hypothetical protein